MSHLENLLFEWYDWRGYIVKRNVKVGRLDHGGWAGELDIVAYHPDTRELVHLEPSIDAHSWQKREQRFTKKFEAGRRHIYDSVFPWLNKRIRLRQVAVLVSRGGRETVAGCQIVTVDELMAEMKEHVGERGRVARGAIPEQYPLLRTIQLVVNGYHRVL